MGFKQQMRRGLSCLAMLVAAAPALLRAQAVSLPAAFGAMSRAIFSIESPAIPLDACSVRSVAGLALLDSLAARSFPLVRADSARSGACAATPRSPYRALTRIDAVPDGVDLKFRVVVGGSATEVVRIRRGARGTLVAAERLQSEFMDVQSPLPPPPRGRLAGVPPIPRR
jgi:hypothetical protein